MHNVEKSFGTRQVVRGVSIYVRRGEAVGNASQQLNNLPPPAACSQLPILERAAVDELRHQVLPTLELARIEHGEDMWVVE